MTKKKRITNPAKIDLGFYMVLGGFGALLADNLPWLLAINTFIITVVALCLDSLFHYAKSWIK
ncbi:hypothetical protein ACQTPQ_04630 [Streptococcus hyovaginalis]|uniref:hypothetical protein n=1 Tax=Streptococcus hyovaginalis TaxID=149015 RepID=UPI002A815716|nr:hypothetical protein [Streptococcus hyovaginalis]MDY4510188.1 hypothetical protein [Streptococcus hyovaginalis]